VNDANHLLVFINIVTLNI